MKGAAGGWAFAVVLWVLATLFLGGDLGKWGDDHQWVQRDPATGEVLRWTTEMGGQFWRPLHFLYTTAVMTAFDEQDRIPHMVNAVAHGVAALLVWRLLLGLGRSGRTAAACGLLFLIYPAAFEVILWPSAMSTGVSTSLILVLCLMQVSVMRGGLGRLAVLGPAMGAVALAAACFNEQPVGAIVALPVVGLAAAPAGMRAGGMLPRVILPAALCGAAAAGYLAVYLSNPNVGPGMVRPSTVEVVESLPRYWHMIRREMTLRQFGPGAFAEGWRTLAERPMWSTAVLAGLLAAAGGWWRWWACGAGAAVDAAESRGRRRRVDVVTAAAGAVFFAGAWGPIVATGYSVDSRLCYAPMVGVLMAFAVVLDGAGAWLGRRRSRGLRGFAEAAGAAGLMFVLLLGAIALVGVQHAYQRRAELDRWEGAQLRELVPRPLTDSFFLPLGVQSQAVRTGSRELDEHIFSAWGVPWSSRWFIQRVYRRGDVHCGFFWPWRPLPPLQALWGVDERGIRYSTPMGGPFLEDPAGGYRVPWEAVIPFEVDREGRVHLVTHISAEQGDGSIVDVGVPQTVGLEIPERRFHLRFPPHSTP